MLRRLRVQGYKTLRDVDVQLGPLNVLIGPNASGKSNLLDAFALLHEYGKNRLEDAVYARGGLNSILWAGGELDAVKIGLAFAAALSEDADWEFRLQLRKSGIVFVPGIQFDRSDKFAPFEDNSPSLARGLPEAEQRDEAKQELHILFRNIAAYTHFDTTPDSLIRQPSLVRPQTRLVNGGYNLANVMNYLSSMHEYRDAYEDILDVLGTAYPDFDELSFPPEGGDGRIVMRWKEKSLKHDFAAYYLSDGILRFLCLLAILKTPDPPPLVCIDEPELGLHPSLMPIIAALLRDASSRTQLIIATHSPQLVDALDVEHIVIMDRVDGETRVQRLQERPQLDAWLEHYTKGELWLSGELGGMPW